MGDIAMVFRVIERRNDGNMIIAPLGYANAGRFARRRLAAFTGQQQLATQLGTTGQCDMHARLIALYTDRPVRHVKPDSGAVDGDVAQCLPQHSVLEHVAKRFIVFSGGEIECVLLEPVADLDAVNGTAMRLQTLGNAKCIKHAPACARNRAGPTVEARSQRLFRIERVDNGCRQSMSIKGNGQRQADKAPAKDDDIARIHSSYLGETSRDSSISAGLLTASHCPAH